MRAALASCPLAAPGLMEKSKLFCMSLFLKELMFFLFLLILITIIIVVSSDFLMGCIHARLSVVFRQVSDKCRCFCILSDMWVSVARIPD